MKTNYIYLAQSIYLVTVRTANVVQTATTENVEMIVRGSDGQIAKILLKDYAKLKEKQLFRQGNLDEFEIEHNDIGDVRLFLVDGQTQF